MSHWFFSPFSQPYSTSHSIPLFLPFFLLHPPLFYASWLSVLLVQPYQWSNLAATAWVSVARRVASLSSPAVAEINPQIEQSPRWPLQTPKSRCAHPTNWESLCLKLFSLDGKAWGPSIWRRKANECVCAGVCVWKKESVWGQGALSEREMDKREGLRRLTEHVYISNGTLLQEGGREEKSARQTKHSSVHLLSLSCPRQQEVPQVY